MSNRDYFDYRIRIQVPRGSPDAILLESLKHDLHPSFSHREMVLWALRGYWLPTAYQLQNHQGKAIADDELKPMALDAIHRLKEQIFYIETTFGVRTADQGAIALPVLQALLSDGANSGSCQGIVQNGTHAPHLVVPPFSPHQSAKGESSELNANPPLSEPEEVWYEPKELFE